MICHILNMLIITMECLQLNMVKILPSIVVFLKTLIGLYICICIIESLPMCNNELLKILLVCYCLAMVVHVYGPTCTCMSRVCHDECLMACSNTTQNIDNTLSNTLNCAYLCHYFNARLSFNCLDNLNESVCRLYFEFIFIYYIIFQIIKAELPQYGIKVLIVIKLWMSSRGGSCSVKSIRVDVTHNHNTNMMYTSYYQIYNHIKRYRHSFIYLICFLVHHLLHFYYQNISLSNTMIEYYLLVHSTCNSALIEFHCNKIHVYSYFNKYSRIFNNLSIIKNMLFSSCYFSQTYHIRRLQLVNYLANNTCKVIFPCVQCGRIAIITFYTEIILIVLYFFLKSITKIYIFEYLTHCLKFSDTDSTSTCNPLTTTDYKWVSWRKKSKYSYFVYPVQTSLNDNLPFRKINNNELINTVLSNDSNKDNLDGVLNDHNIDYSTLGDIDPDTHFLTANKHIKSHYYTETEFNKFVDLDNKFTLFNVNIRSIPKNFDRMRYYLYELNHNFSVLSITESWLKQYNRSTYNMKGYTHLSKIREDRTGGGVSLFVKKELRYELKEEILLDLPGVDSIAIEIPKEDLNSVGNVIVLAMYRPPDINPKLFIEKLSQLLQQLYKQNKQVFIMGDFNINISEILVTTDKTVNEFYNTFLSYYFYPLINQPTRVHAERKSIIDNIFTNSPNIIRSGILKTEFSDHYSLFCITDLNRRVIKTKEVVKRELSAPNFRKCSEILKTTDWDPVYNLGDFEHSFKFFHDTILTILDDSFPIKNVKLKYDNRIPYLTNGLKQSIKRKHKLREIYENNPTAENKDNYKNHRNKLTALLRITERKYHENQLEINKNDSTICWKITKEVIGTKHSINSDSCVFKINDTEVKDKEIICNEFNNFFVNIGSKLTSKCKSSKNPLQFVKSNMNSMFISNITEAEVTETILDLNNSSPGYDEVPAIVMKQNIHALIKPLTYLINCSINKGIFPDELKIAKVIPIYKSGDKTSIENYRPISVLSVFSKVFEKIMYNHLINFINKHNILYKYQFGFRKRHSTNHAIITLVDKISTALDRGNVVIGCFLDLKKAFDTVNHSILISKLYKYGIRGNSLQWFKSYLANRQQFVQIHTSKSNTETVTCGVPQGSILGPLLFILYINDLSNVSDVLFPILFADDTSVYIEAENESLVISILNEELEKINTWLKANKLSLNLDKSHYMVFHRGKRKIDFDTPSLNHISLKRVKFTKFLGVIIDDQLKWSNHILYIKNKIAKGFGIILRARKFFNRKTLQNLYHSFIFPYLIYCVEIWGSASDAHLLPLILLQKKIVRVISFSPYLAHTKEIFLKLNILPFKDLVVHRIGIQMFKNNVGFLPNAVENLFTANATVHNYNTRNKHKLRAARGIHQYVYSTFRFVGIKVWNYITDHINTQVSLPKFKKILKTHIQSDSFTLAL